MRNKLRILHLEDNSHDRELVKSLLERDGMACAVHAVETEEEFLAALDHSNYDLIISDYTLPSYDGLSALDAARARLPEVPYLFVSGTLGEEQAIQSLQNGATDYVLKHRLQRLVPAVQRALREKEERIIRKKAELVREQFAELAYTLNQARTVEQAARIIVRVAKALINWDQCTLSLYVPDEDLIRIVLKIDTIHGQELDIPIESCSQPPTPYVKKCIRNGGQLLLTDELPTGEILDPAIKNRLTPSMLMVPVRNGTRTTGILTVQKYGPISYNKTDLETLQALADQCGGALERIWAEHEKESLIHEVQDQQKRLDHILSTMHAVVWEAWIESDPSQYHTNFVSPFVQTLLGYTAEEWLSDRDFWLSIIHPDDRRRIEQDLEKLHAGLPGITHQFRWLTKNGEIVWVENSAKLVRHTNAKPLGLRCVALDITDHKLMESQLLRSQRLESIGTLASGIAHDLNNILSPILMSVQMLRNKFQDEDSQSMLALSENYAKRGAEIIRQILTFARGKSVERVPVHPRLLLEEINSIVRGTFPKDVVPALHYSADVWSIEGDPTQLHQVLLNLCINARDAMPDGGELTIEAENILLDSSCLRLSPDAKPGAYLMLRVTDTGVGIPAEIIDKIFDPFFTTKSVGKGSGLGLSTVLGIVRNHGGFVTVQSTPMVRTQFTVFLPALQPHEEEPVQLRPRTWPDGAGKTILVVDDESGIRDLAGQILRNQGYTVLTANDGREATEIYEKHQGEICLVLTDLMMPGISGFAVIRKIKSLNPDAKIIACSGLLEGSTLVELDSLEVKVRLAKPYTASQMLEVVSQELAVTA